MKYMLALIIFMLIGVSWIFSVLIARAYSGSLDSMCPKSITVEETMPSAPAGWEVQRDNLPRLLMSVTMYDGHPDEKASLVPSGETRKKNRITTTWKLDPENARRYWLACSYSGTRMFLSKKLAAGISACSVTSDAGITISGHPVIERIQCE